MPALQQNNLTPDDHLKICLTTAGSGGTTLKDLHHHLVQTKQVFQSVDQLTEALNRLADNNWIILQEERYYQRQSFEHWNQT